MRVVLKKVKKDFVLRLRMEKRLHFHISDTSHNDILFNSVYLFI